MFKNIFVVALTISIPKVKMMITQEESLGMREDKNCRHRDHRTLDAALFTFQSYRYYCNVFKLTADLYIQSDLVPVRRFLQFLSMCLFQNFSP